MFLNVFLLELFSLVTELCGGINDGYGPFPSSREGERRIISKEFLNRCCKMILGPFD